MGKIQDFHITYDKQWATFSNGETVTGSVELEFDDRYYCDRITAQFYGSARVFWTEREAKSTYGFQNVPYSAEKVFIDRKQDLWASTDTARTKFDESLAPGLRLNSHNIKLDENRPHLNAGRHKLQFSFDLPDDCITSFDPNHVPGYVRYFVKVLVFERNVVKAIRKVPFVVVRPFDLAVIPSAASSQIIEVCSNVPSKIKGIFGILFPNVGYFNSAGKQQRLRVKTFITLQKTGYTPGERILLSVEIQNDTGSKIKHVIASLIQVTTCYSQKPDFRTNTSEKVMASVLCAEYPASVGKQHTTSLMLEPGNLLIPAVTPTFNEVGIMEVNYLVRVDVVRHRGFPAKLATVDADVIVGTVAVAPDGSKYPTKSTKPQMLSPVHFSDVPPPSYAESMQKLPFQSEDEESDYTVFTIQTKSDKLEPSYII